MKPRPYQEAAIDAVVDAWSAGRHAPVIALPTGAGKTITAAMLLRRCRDEAGGGRAAWLTDRSGLIDRTAEEIEACGLSVAVVRAPKWRTMPDHVAECDVLLIMSQTAQSREWLPEDLGVSVVVVDEAHYQRAVTVRWLETGVPMVGLSATPLARWMHDAGEPWTGPLVAPLTTRQLIEQGQLLAPTLLAEQDDPTELQDPLTGQRFQRNGPDWSDSESEAIMSPYTRMIAQRWRDLCDAPAAEGGYGGEQPPTLVIASTIDHAGELADAFRVAAGPGRIWRVVSARDGFSAQALEEFRNGASDGLVSVHMLTVGVDLPSATIGVSARPTRSLATWLQFLGRFMRTGSASPTVQDWGGTALRLALPLHEFWTRGPEWPLPAARANGGSESASTQPGLPEPCPHHPRVIHQPGTRGCSVCGRPLSQPVPESEKMRKRFRADTVTLADIGRSILRMAQDRACRPPLDGGVAARRWARAMVQISTGRPPRRGWPAAAWRDKTQPMPHPLVARVVRKAAQSYARWMSTPADDRPEKPEAVDPLAWEP